MSIPDFQTLMLPVLRLSADGEVRIADIISQLADQLKLTQEEREVRLPSGNQGLFTNRVHWAKFHLSKAGLIQNTRRAHLKITELGQTVLASPPKRIDLRFLHRYPQFKQFRDRSAQDTVPDDQVVEPVLASQTRTPDEIMRVAHKQIEELLAQDLLDRIRAAPPEFFERLLVKLLLGMGFGGSAADAGRAIGRSGDGGVDGVIDQDVLGLDRVYVQAKRYADGKNIGPDAIREFFGSLDHHKAAKGVFVTTSTFTPSARRTAEGLSKRIVLIDAGQLTALMIRHNVGCRDEDILHIKKVDEDFFE